MLKIITNSIENKPDIIMKTVKVTICLYLEYRAQIWLYLSKNTAELEKKSISMTRPIKNTRQLLYKRPGVFLEKRWWGKDAKYVKLQGTWKQYEQGMVVRCFSSTKTR